MLLLIIFNVTIILFFIITLSIKKTNKLNITDHITDNYRLNNCTESVTNDPDRFWSDINHWTDSDSGDSECESNDKYDEMFSNKKTNVKCKTKNVKNKKCAKNYHSDDDYQIYNKPKNRINKKCAKNYYSDDCKTLSDNDCKTKNKKKCAKNNYSDDCQTLSDDCNIKKKCKTKKKYLNDDNNIKNKNNYSDDYNKNRIKMIHFLRNLPKNPPKNIDKFNKWYKKWYNYMKGNECNFTEDIYKSKYCNKSVSDKCENKLDSSKYITNKVVNNVRIITKDDACKVSTNNNNKMCYVSTDSHDTNTEDSSDMEMGCSGVGNDKKNGVNVVAHANVNNENVNSTKFVNK